MNPRSDDTDFELIRLCDELLVVMDYVVVCSEADRHRSDNVSSAEPWARAQELADLIEPLAPRTPAGIRAKARAAWTLACDGMPGSIEPQSNGLNDQLAFALARDLAAD